MKLTQLEIVTSTVGWADMLTHVMVDKETFFKFHYRTQSTFTIEIISLFIITNWSSKHLCKLQFQSIK